MDRLTTDVLFSLEVLEMNQELGNIPRLFLQQPNGCFWVAEVMESSEACDLDMLIDKVKKVSIFLNSTVWCMNSNMKENLSLS